MLSRRSLFIAAWLMFLASLLIPAPAGSFAGGAAGISGILCLRQGHRLESKRAGKRRGARLLASSLFSRWRYSRTLRSCSPSSSAITSSVSATCKGFLAGSVLIGASVAALFPEFAQLPAYWLWLASLGVLTVAFVGFPGSGVATRTAPRRASANTANPDTGDVPAARVGVAGIRVILADGVGRQSPASRPGNVARRPRVLSSNADQLLQRPGQFRSDGNGRATQCGAGKFRTGNVEPDCGGHLSARTRRRGRIVHDRRRGPVAAGAEGSRQRRDPVRFRRRAKSLGSRSDTVSKAYSPTSMSIASSTRISRRPLRKVTIRMASIRRWVRSS